MKIICINKFVLDPETKTMEFVESEYYASLSECKRALSYLRGLYDEECLSVVVISSDDEKKSYGGKLRAITYSVGEIDAFTRMP